MWRRWRRGYTTTQQAIRPPKLAIPAEQKAPKSLGELAIFRMGAVGATYRSRAPRNWPDPKTKTNLNEPHRTKPKPHQNREPSCKLRLRWHYHWRFNCGRLLLAFAGGLTAHRYTYMHLHIYHIIWSYYVQVCVEGERLKAKENPFCMCVIANTSLTYSPNTTNHGGYIKKMPQA